MLSLLLTLAVFGLLIAAVEFLCWTLFRRKMEPMQFPSANDPHGSYDFYIRKLRTFAFIHSAILILFCIFFCSILWW